jgi:hypothetical protein
VVGSISNDLGTGKKMGSMERKKERKKEGKKLKRPLCKEGQLKTRRWKDATAAI